MKNPKLSLGLSGHFKFVATKEDGTQRTLADWNDNLILDSGLNRLGTNIAWSHCRVGTGNTAPDAGQTALVSALAATTTITSTVAGTNTPTDTYAWARQTYRFGLGVAEGNLSEVGIGWDSGLFSRALIKDEFGDPTTIVVLDDEYLDVVYEVRAYPDMTDQETTLTISGVDYDFTLRPAKLTGNQSNVANWPEQLISLMTNGFISEASTRLGIAGFDAGSTLGAVTASLTGSAIAAGDGAFTASYVDNSYERECRMTFGIAQGAAAFGGFQLTTMAGVYQIVVDPVIPKDNTKVFTLDLTLSWARKTI